MEHWWNDTDSRKLKYSKKNFSQLHFIHQIVHEVAWDWTRSSVVRGQQLTAGAMAQLKWNAVVAVQGNHKQLLQVHICGYSTSKWNCIYFGIWSV